MSKPYWSILHQLHRRYVLKLCRLMFWEVHKHTTTIGEANEKGGFVLYNFEREFRLLMGMGMRVKQCQFRRKNWPRKAHQMGKAWESQTRANMQLAHMAPQLILVDDPAPKGTNERSYHCSLPCDRKRPTMEWRMSKGVVTKHGENEGRNFMRNGPPTLWWKSTVKDQASTFQSSGEGVDKDPVGGSVDKNNWGRRTFGTGSDVCGSTVSDMWVLVHRLPSHLPISNRHCIPRNFSDVKEKYARPSPRQVLGGRDWSSCTTKLTGQWPKNCRELQGVQGDL